MSREKIASWVVLFLPSIVLAAACSEEDTGRSEGIGGVEARGGQGGSITRGGGTNGGASGSGAVTGGTGNGTGGGPRCLPGQTDGQVLAVANLEEGELQTEGLAYFEYDERYNGFIAQRDGGWLVAGYHGFWDVSDGGERARVEAPGDGFVYGFLVRDLDSDGNEDVVSIHEDGSDRGGTSVPVLAVWQRAGDGSLERRATLEPGHGEVNGELQPTAVADVDRDGDFDLVTFYLGTPMLHRHDGDFGFDTVEGGPQFPLERVNVEVRHLELYDADGDDTVDIVGAFHQTNGSDNTYVAFLSGNDAGQFSEAVFSDFGVSYENAVYGGHDLTGDGIFDLVLLDIESETSTFTIMEGAADGTFEIGVARTVGYFGLVLADINDDGVGDVLANDAEGLVTELALGGGAFETVRYGVAAGQVRTLAFAGAAGDMGRIGLVINSGCFSPCDEGCSGECFAGQCFECTQSSQCGGEALCLQGTCDVCAPPCGGGGGAGLGAAE